MEYLSKNTVIRIINHQKIIPLFEREYLQEHIKLEKAAEVVEVKHGEWREELVKRCDWRGKKQQYFQPNSYSVCHKAVVERTPYCPNCGARMDGGKAE